MNPSSGDIKTFLLRDDGTFPNHPKWPLLIYLGAATLPPASTDPASIIESMFRKNGWGGLWRNGIYPYHHYHSNAHEVLGIFNGSAHVLFGGPSGVEIELHAGDVAVLPAGTTHRNMGCSGDFGVVGGYPEGAGYDMCYGKPEERAEAMITMAKVPRPEVDPVFGRDGGLRIHWPSEEN